MAFWHELTRVRNMLSRYSANGMTKQIVCRCDQEEERFEAYFVRQSSPGLFPPAEDCVQLWPVKPIVAPTVAEARDKALLLLEAAASGALDELFEMRPCPLPFHRKRVKKVESPTHRASAWIAQDSETRFEVRYFGDLLDSLEEGWRLSVPSDPTKPMPQGFQYLTIADSIESAEQIARAELAILVSGGEIKPKNAVDSNSAHTRG